MTESVKLFGRIGSPNVLRVALALEEKQIPYELIENIMIDEFLKNSRWGLMPCIEYQGNYISESLAILEFLEDQFPDKPLLPDSIVEKAQARSWMYRVALTVLDTRRKIWFGPDKEQAKQELKEQLEDINKELEGKTFLVANTYTLADLNLSLFYVALDEFKNVLGTDLDQLPNLKKHKEAITSRPSFKKLDPSESFAGFIKGMADEEIRAKIVASKQERIQKWKEQRS
ncbi:hypothetical protein COV18_03155 [Candidatus Woesearchaeota archaeon CG10_big_fil_rev_8_21_14_0_10_37_12]|nr:MAG: hypothetical protein COV18_03155 [Candidatus Woesearchaeota archaeon CG10_big_fil_rev_8_21_14_0_10_37_12]